jgi:beta-barrel assembly-enhancing protease
MSSFVLRCAVALTATALLVLLPACESIRAGNSKAAKRFRTNIGNLGKEVKTAGGALYDTVNDAVKTMDAAMGGCTLSQRDAFDLDSQEEYQLGRIVAAEHIASLQVDDLGPTHPVSVYVDRVGQLLVVAAELYGERNVKERSEVPEKALDNRPSPLGGYHFVVLKREDPNAFGGPGGMVMVTTGLLRKLQSEEELAAVLAHEIAHVQRGHGVEVMKAFMCKHASAEKASAPVKKLAQMGDQVGGRLARGLALKNADRAVLTELVDSVTDHVSALYEVGYPREFELESDRIAVRYLQVAGYDTTAVRTLLERLQKDAADDDYGRTHPSFARRIQAVEPLLAHVPVDRKPAQAAVAVRTARFHNELSRLAPPEGPVAGAH